VHALPPESVGGTEIHVRSLAEAQARNHDVLVFGPELRGMGGRSFLERTRFAPAERACGRKLAEFRPDVVHVHHLADMSAGILGIAADGGARVVLTIHDHALACPRGQRIRLDLDPCPVLDRDRCVKCVRPAWIEAARSPDRLRALLGLFRPGEGRRLFGIRDSHIFQNLDRVSVFIAPSRSAADLFAEFYPAAKHRLRVIPHGVSGPAAVPPPPPAREAGAPFVAGFFGSVLPSKGVGLLAAVAAHLGSEVRIELHGGGDGGLLEALHRQSGGRLRVAGPYQPEELSTRLAGVHAVLVPSLWPETFSIVVREAWAHRRPVLGSETGALIEAAGPARDRIGLVAPGDVNAWIAAVRRLATDRAWYAQLAGPHAPESFQAMLEATMACYTGGA
jgi:glycosyltransferase involved in cell wall biosynthesis